jgi:putative glutamine amidotransferase
VQELAVKDADHLVRRLDGVILTGGPDVGPDLYGAARHPKTGKARDSRDAVEAALCRAASRNVPILAICRGLQILNVVRSGTLHQHLPELVGSDEHAPDPKGYGLHEVLVDGGSLLAKLLGTERTAVPTHHHQAIDALGEGLVVTARTADGIIEAVEDPDAGFLVGVQWHPEAGDDPSLFEGLVAAASAGAAGQ